MARCHNCGRETLRTEDWACQWCGYPLMSGAYGKIEKTYRQLREERLLETEEGPLPESEPEVAAEPEEAVEPEPEPEGKQPEEIEVKEEKTQETEEPVEEKEGEEEKAQEPEPETEQEIELEEGTPDEAEAVVVAAEAETEIKAESEPESEPEIEAETEVETIEEAEPEAEPEPELGPADMEINVTEVFKAYQEDDAAADKRFIGKVIEMTGVISMIDIKSVSDMHCIRLTGSEGDLMESVKCMFGKKHAQSLMGLEKGQTVTVQGRYDGSIIAMRMVDCVLVK